MNVAKAMSIHRRRSITIDKLPDKNKVMFLYGLFWPFVHGGFVVCLFVLFHCFYCSRSRGSSDWFLGFIFSGLGKNNLHNIALSCIHCLFSVHALTLPMALTYSAGATTTSTTTYRIHVQYLTLYLPSLRRIILF